MQSKKIFIAADTFIALIDRQNPKHLQADAFFRYFSQEKYQLYTNIISINNAYIQIKAKISPSLAKDFLKSMLIGNINILYPEESDFKASMKLIISQASNEISLEEAFIAVVCNKRNISQICTFEYFHSFFGLQLFYLPI